MKCNKKMEAAPTARTSSIRHDNDKKKSLVIYYKNVAVTGFATEIVLTGEEYAPIKKSSAKSLYFVVLDVYQGRNCELKSKIETPFLELCLMDGSHGVFRARLHSRLTKLVAKNLSYFTAGNIVGVAGYQILWLKSQDHFQSRFVMLVGQIQHHCSPPKVSQMLHPEFVCDRIDKDVLWQAMDHSMVVFMSQKLVGKFRQWTLMPVADLKRGYFLPEGLQRAQFVAGSRKRKFDQEGACACTSKLGMRDCVLDVFPIFSVDFVEAFQQQKFRLKNSGDDFDCLHQTDKRLCVAKYYILNYVSLAGGSYSIPLCFQDSLRKMFPDPKGEFFCRQRRVCSHKKV